MFVRQCYRNKNGRRHAYWALVESYRTERGPRQRTVAYLGALDEAGRMGIEQAAKARFAQFEHARRSKSSEPLRRIIEGMVRTALQQR